MEKILKIVLLIAIMVLVPVNICVGQALVKYKIHCTNVNKSSKATHKNIVEYDEDVLLVTTYDNNVSIRSEKFNKTIKFGPNCKHIKDKSYKIVDEDGGERKGIYDVFFNSHNHSLSYLRTKKHLLKPLLQIVLDDGYYYNFNVAYGEIFDKKDSKWVLGQAAAVTSYENDKVRRRLRMDLGELCPDFEYELEERIKLEDDDDPWKQ